MLDVGAGSGYSAAVLGLVARSIHAIERHDVLTRLARERLESLGYRNIALRTGDGTAGWPDAALFDAILVSAAGPDMPAPLKVQLAIGGRLVMPVGAGRSGGAHLVKTLRTGESEYDRQILTSVSFATLIGAHGWAEDGQPRAPRIDN